eukprot:TRINITY_DN1366_c0_g1_i4.p1 TRINITY_DN1366_c0_g1~~TRINITY_DN1366_c0_g1_i4.p1  ORF type:complete len:140 (+),score=20.78 TRINITY_DN1366_c0_g1_i4:131-550(+)
MRATILFLGVMVAVMLMTELKSQPLRVTGSLCTPTTGGSTSLTGLDFNSVSSFAVSVGSFSCVNVRALSPETLSCTIPAGQGVGYPISVNGVQGTANFSYCPPTISSVSIVTSATNQSFLVSVQGDNFGTDASAISISV